MSARCSQPVAVSEVSRTIRTTHTTYGNPRLVVRVEVDVYRYWDSCHMHETKKISLVSTTSHVLYMLSVSRSQKIIENIQGVRCEYVHISVSSAD